MYIDGFAGPGQYVGGDDGSPIIALKAAIGQQERIVASIDYVFVEKEQDRADYLARLVRGMALPTRFRVQVFGDQTFEDVYTRVIRPSRVGQTPVFAFLDPFGWTGIPFAIVGEIVSAQGAELLVTFMF